MTNFAYLRVSTNAQDARNQKLGVLEYCNARGLVPLKIVTDEVSTQVAWHERKIGKIAEFRLNRPPRFRSSRTT